MARRRRIRGEGGIYQRESDGRWVGSVDLGVFDGKRRRRVVYGATAAEVRTKLEQARNERAAGLRFSGRLTLGAYLERWLEVAVEPSVAPRTFDSYRGICRSRIIPHLGSRKLDKLTSLDIQGLYTDLAAAGLSSRSILHTHRTLKLALKQAVGWGVIARNPADGVTPPSPGRAGIHPLTREEATALLKSARGTADYSLYFLAITTGMREGELLGLRWADVELDAGRLRVSQTLQRQTGRGLVFGQPKTAGSRRVVMLSAEVVKVLRAHRREQLGERMKVANFWEDHDLVFPRTLGRPQEPSEVVVRFHRVTGAAGLPRVRFHDLRHTAATLLLAEGTHPKVVSEMLGHANIGITLDTYSHYVPALHTAAAETMDRLFGTGSAR